MARRINFVSARRKVLTGLEEKDRRWFGIAVKVLSGIFAVFLVVFGLRMFFMLRLQRVVEAQEQTRQAILSHEAVEKEYTIFAHKLKQLSQIYVRRAEKQEALDFFNQLFGQDIQISEIVYTTKGNEDVLSFTLRTHSVFQLDEVFSKLSSAQVKDKFNAVQKETLRRGADGSYGMQITLVLDGGASARE